MAAEYVGSDQLQLVGGIREVERGWAEGIISRGAWAEIPIGDQTFPPPSTAMKESPRLSIVNAGKNIGE